MSSSRIVPACIAALGAVLVLAAVVFGFLPLNACGSAFVSGPVAGARMSECDALGATGGWVVSTVGAGLALMGVAMVVRSMLQRTRRRDPSRSFAGEDRSVAGMRS